MRAELDEFLAPFPRAVVEAVAQEAGNGAIVVLPDPSLAEFRRAPLASVKAVSAALRDLWRNSSTARLVVCIAGSAGTGLDGFEVPAIVGRYLHLTFVHQHDAPGERRIVAAGTLRDEHVSMMVAPANGETDLERWLAAVTATGVPAIVLLTPDEAAALRREATAAFMAGDGTFGLRVPADRRAAALGDGANQAASLTALCGRPPVIVRFDGGSPEAAALDRFMRATGITCDTSVPIDAGAAAPESMVRDAAYAGASPYRPQPFDVRMPWFQTEPGMWFELPAQPVNAAGLPAWWNSRFGPSDEELAPLLDSTRMEAFYRASRIDPAAEQRYPDFRVYNWPAPAPPSRVALLDGGRCSAESVTALTSALETLIASAGPRAHLIGGAELVAQGRLEVETRYATSTRRAIEAQNEAHEYLATVPNEAPLRPDYADFARFVAAELGDTLELGSGYGVLAWALSLRATRYVCVDLDRHMFTALRRDLGQAGLVADMHRLPFTDAAFDSVIANNVLEHLYDPLAGLREIRRVLKPGGRVFALVPLDALNSRHALPAHLWKLDEPSIRAGFAAAGYAVARLEIVHLNEIGVIGAFPTCHGLAAKVEAVNGEAPVAPTVRAPRAPAMCGLPGRLLPMLREVAAFERWKGRRVLAINSEPSDVEEFRHFGAEVAMVTVDGTRVPANDAAADLVYAFLTLPAASLPALAADLRRVVAPGGAVVAGFRNRNGLRYLARVRSYFGVACDLDAMLGRDAAVAVADDDGASADRDYTTAEEVRRAFAGFSTVSVSVRGLTPDDVPAVVINGDPRFSQWLSQALGRFIFVRAVR